MKQFLVGERRSFVFAFIASVICALIRWMLNPLLVTHPTLTLLLPAVVFAGFLGGLRPAIFATCVCAVFGVLEMEFHPFTHFNRQTILLETLSFMIVGVAISVIADQFHRARSRANDMSRRRASIELTEKLRAQEEAYQQLRHLADTMPHLVWITRPDGYHEFYNQRWYDYVGVSESQSVGNQWANPLHPDDVERSRARWAESLATGKPYEIEYRFRRHDGVYRWFVGRALPLRDEKGVITKWFGTCTDIDDAKQTQSRMELLQAAVESANDSVIITEAQLELPGPRIEYVNPAFSRMTGYSSEEVLGKTPRILQGPKTDRALLDRIRKDLSTNYAFHGETINYRKDGSEYFVEWRITPLRDSNGTVTHWVAVQRDVSARVHTEQALRTLASDREALLDSERAARMEQERIGRMKDEFLATLSHELRTPLNAILGWAQILGREAPNRTPADAKKAVDTIYRNAKVQSQLIDDLLDMSRIISGKISLHVQPINLTDTVSAAIESVQHAADAKDIKISKVLDTSLGPVNADASRLQQVFWNLLSNAIKFTPKQGRVEVMVRKQHSGIEIHISDNGQGISPDFLPYIFDRFRQADGSISRRHGGLGLGLSIVKQMVELHGGSIRAESEGLGKGATFTVVIPLMSITQGRLANRQSIRDLAAVDHSSNHHTDCASLKGLKILVVDDEPDARLLIKRFLEECDAEVTVAAGAQEALELIRGDFPDVIVSDIGMPGMDGLEFIRKIRERSDADGGRTPSVALTAFARPEDRQRVIAAGYQVHVAKPVEASELIATIASLAHVT